MGLTMGERSSALNLPIALVYAAVPVSGVLMVIHLLTGLGRPAQLTGSGPSSELAAGDPPTELTAGDLRTELTGGDAPTEETG